MAALGIDGLIDYCESLDITFTKLYEEDEGFNIYHAWIDSDDMMLLKLKFPKLNKYNFERSEHGTVQIDTSTDYQFK